MWLLHLAARLPCKFVAGLHLPLQRLLLRDTSQRRLCALPLDVCFLLFTIACALCAKPRLRPQLIWCAFLPLWGQGPVKRPNWVPEAQAALAWTLVERRWRRWKNLGRPDHCFGARIAHSCSKHCERRHWLCPALERMSLDLFCSNEGRAVALALEPLAHVNLMLNDFLPAGMAVLLCLSMLEDDRCSEGFNCAPDEMSRRQQ